MKNPVSGLIVVLGLPLSPPQATSKATDAATTLGFKNLFMFTFLIIKNTLYSAQFNSLHPSCLSTAKVVANFD
jgi:hypothetical protein